jgi:hypothetical protein
VAWRKSANPPRTAVGHSAETRQACAGYSCLSLHSVAWQMRSRTCSRCSASLRSSRCWTKATRSRFGCGAYESAAHGIDAFAGDLARLSLRELQQIEGIGKSTAEKIRELIDKGRVSNVELPLNRHLDVLPETIPNAVSQRSRQPQPTP